MTVPMTIPMIAAVVRPSDTLEEDVPIEHTPPPTFSVLHDSVTPH